MSNLLKTLFNLEPGEEKLVALTLLQSIFVGFPRLFTVTVSSALFLEKYSADKLPYVFIASALLIPVIGLFHLQLAKRMAFIKLQSRTLLVLAFVTSAFLTLLWFLPSTGWPTFLLWVWFSTEWTLTNIVFWGVASRLFTARQAKRLFGLVGAGEVLTIIIGGLLMPYLVAMLGTRNLLLFSLLGFLLSFINLFYINRAFRLKLAEKPLTEQSHSTTERPSSFFSLFKVRHIVLIFIIYGFLAYTMDYYLNNIFFIQLNARYPEASQIAVFIGQFMAIFGISSLIFRVFISGRWLTKFGLQVSLVTVPLLVSLGALLIVLFSFLSMVAMVFWLTVALKLFKDVLTGAISFPAYYMLYQPLSIDQRSRTQVSAETIVGPLLGALVGVLLLVLIQYFKVTTLGLSSWLFIIAVLGVIVAVAVSKTYRQALATVLTLKGIASSLNHHEAHRFQLLEKDLSNLPVSEILYILKLMSEVETITTKDKVAELLLKLLDHPQSEVRVAVYEAFEKLTIAESFEPLKERLFFEEEPLAKAALLRALGAIGSNVDVSELIPRNTTEASNLLPFYTADAFNLVSLYLEEEQPEVRRGAIVSLILYFGMEGAVTAGTFLLDKEKSSNVKERHCLAVTLGQIGIPTLYRTLAPLLLDEDLNVRKSALIAAGQIHNPRLCPLIIHNLKEFSLRKTAVKALIEINTSAFSALEAAYPLQSLVIRRQIVNIYGKTQHQQAIPLLLDKLHEPDRDLRFEVLNSLYSCGCKTIESTILEELLQVEADYGLAILLAKKEFIPKKNKKVVEEIMLLVAALDHELEKLKQRIFLLLSFLYTSELIMKISDNAQDASPEQRDLAFELFDNVVYKAHRKLVAPALFQTLAVTPKLPPFERIKEMLSNPLIWNNPWIIACAIEAAKAMVKASMEDFQSYISPLLYNSHEWVRETAQHALRASQITHFKREQPEHTAMVLPIVEKVKILKAISLFAELPGEILAEESDLFEEWVVPAAEEVLSKGELGHALYVIVVGSLRVHDGENTLVELQVGQNFGTLKALDPKFRMTSVTTLTSSYLLRLSQENLAALIENRIEVARGVINFLHTRLLALLAEVEAIAEKGQIEAIVDVIDTSTKETQTISEQVEKIDTPSVENMPLTLLEKIIILKGIQIFAQTPDEVLSEIAYLTQEIFLKQGETLFSKDDEGTYMYLIVNGSIQLHKNEYIIACLGERMSLGELSILATKPRTCSATALKDTRLLAFNHLVMFDLIWKRHEIIQHIIQILVQHLRELKAMEVVW